MRSAIRLFLRLLGLPLSFGTSRLPRGAHITRYVMYETLSKVINDPLRGSGAKILSISHSENLIRHMGLEKAQVVKANYHEYTAVDLSAFRSGDFDYVLSEQVLEHIEGNPQDVFDETWRVLKPGGIAVHTTTFVQPLHGFPSDFWRFSLECLKMLAKRFSEVIELGGFGNRWIWV